MEARCHRRQLIIDGDCTSDVAEEIEKRINVKKESIQVKSVQSERGDSFHVVTGDRSIVERIYEERANLPDTWSIRDTPGPLDPLRIVLTFSLAYKPAAANFSADTTYETLLDAIQTKSKHNVAYGILLQIQLEDTPNWYRDFCSPEPAPQPIIKVDVTGLISSKPSIYDVEAICEAIDKNGWEDHCIFLTTSCTDLPRPKIIPVPRKPPYLNLPETM